MAVPKQRLSRSRTRRRRAKWKLSSPGLIKCPQCHEQTMPHRVCTFCGYYGGKQVIKKED
ncbi:MAG: 50S ribosomal protein L32 [Firmicutes bacterium]|nr:50S ribosomal protein L32 [Bacillota bacterium]